MCTRARSKRLEGNIKKFEEQGEQVKKNISNLQKASQGGQ